MLKKKTKKLCFCSVLMFFVYNHIFSRSVELRDIIFIFAFAFNSRSVTLVTEAGTINRIID